MALFRYTLILSLIASSIGSQADTLTLSEAKGINLFTVDAKGNIYVADNEHTLHKYDAKGKLVTSANIKTYGEIYSIDCSNPFELYVFHKEQNIMVFYDNMLNIKGSLSLNDFYFNTACVARSYDNNIWILDLTLYKLLKINKQGEILAESPYLNNTLNNSLKVYKLWEHKNNVYMADSGTGIFKFDMYATYSNTYHIKGLQNATHMINELALLKNNTIHKYNPLLLTPVSIKKNVENASCFHYHASKLYFLYEDRIVRLPIMEK